MPGSNALPATGAPTDRRAFDASTTEAALHVVLGILVVVASVSAFAISVKFGIAATFVVSVLVATLVPPSMPIILLCTFLLQNVAVAWFTPYIADDMAFDALRGANFVVLMSAYGVFFAASFQHRLRAVAGARPWLLVSMALAGVVVFYMGLGAVRGVPKDAVIYFRNTIMPIACFHIALVAASLYRVELRRSVAWVGAAAIVYGYFELVFQLRFLGIFHGDQYLQRSLRRAIETGVYQRELEQTGYVLRGLKDTMMTRFFNTSLFSDVFPEIFRIGGPNFHPISYAYALAVISVWLIFRRRWLLALSALPLLVVVGSKGAMFMVLMAMMAGITWRFFGQRATLLAVLGMASLWVVAAIAYGAANADYHVLGMIAGLNGFLHDPIGQGLGIGGNLSSTTEQVDWQRAQLVGSTSVPMESAIGVMLYQMGPGAIVFIAFLGALAASAFRRLRRTGDTDFLFAFVTIVTIVANAVLQEEAFYSPLALGFLMLLVGATFGTHFRRDAEALHARS
ncbi:hypothetical protein [Pararhizobium mangrovi]|uniref:O-antigen ligase domain-containing protein n=1 Tax=Pararhizobium mangrovi TaxID=2590452 RepID=A0A506U232_9HYPH|nr:hypothetical protein [Pararhizobium mangrovi]TPW25927.1 hypothetical protein FJU11_17115 [Pararhizobium mangrovi]